MTPLKVLVNLVSMFFTQNIHNFRGQGVSINHPVWQYPQSLPRPPPHMGSSHKSTTLPCWIKMQPTKIHRRNHFPNLNMVGVCRNVLQLLHFWGYRSTVIRTSSLLQKVSHKRPPPPQPLAGHALFLPSPVQVLYLMFNGLTGGTLPTMVQLYGETVPGVDVVPLLCS